MSCVVYHICRLCDKGDTSKGYIGISSNHQYRWWRHRNSNENPRLHRAYEKYPDIVEYILLIADRQYCLAVESNLRPTKGIAWNIAVGGGNPPNLLNKIMSPEQKVKIGLSNSGKRNSKWKGYWIVNGIYYDSLNIAAKDLGCAKRTVRNRAFNPKFPNWKFQENRENNGTV